MSLRLEMLQVARLAPKLLGESSDLVRGFVGSQRRPDGGFVDEPAPATSFYHLAGAILALSAGR